MNSHLIRRGLLLRFLISSGYNPKPSIKKILGKLKKRVTNEFFAENARQDLLRLTGVMFGSSDFVGAWFRRVNFQAIEVKTLFITYFAISTKNLLTDEQFDPDLFKKLGYLSSDMGDDIPPMNSNKIVVKTVLEFYDNLKLDSTGFFGQMNGADGILIKLLGQFEAYTSSDGSTQTLIQIKQSPNGFFDQVQVSKNEQFCLISLGSLSLLIKDFPGKNLFDLCHGFTQMALSIRDFRFSYDQLRLVVMLVFLLSLHNLVKLEDD
ncbi:hypothetical protein JX580_00555 [Thiomicrospira microaerophila]|uniref:hypothetical protein n=1 Tax=Thiomicrospira microaerophila TaxID=406020 RepID=UPI00200DB6E0|nr:hypothetical protein [Thiomicrospira microaerophila]UQB42440.1 hypothetical protein JX580_00555 [Thiomicrospira microaerophila]